MTSVALKEGQVFVKRKHELADLLKNVEKASKEALELIVNSLTDDKVEFKTKNENAKFLLEFQTKLSDIISKDQLTRQVAEMKANGLSRTLVPDDGKPSAPRLDFGRVQEVN